MPSPLVKIPPPDPGIFFLINMTTTPIARPNEPINFLLALLWAGSSLRIF